MRTLRERDALLEELWKRFGDVPMDPSTETMEAPFLDFPAGTSRVDIWHWFDERHSKGIASRACCTARSSALNAVLKPACSTRRASAWPRS